MPVLFFPNWSGLVAGLLEWGAPGLLVLALLDSAGLPIVGGVDALLVALSAQEPSRAYLAACCAITGSLVGSSILFGIARTGGEVFLSKYIHSRQGARLHSWFERFGLITVFIPALSPIPLPMKIPVFCSGALEVSWRSFLFVMLVARAIRYFTLAYLAMHYGRATFAFLRSHLTIVVVSALLLVVAAMFVLRLFQRFSFSQ